MRGRPGVIALCYLICVSNKPPLLVALRNSCVRDIVAVAHIRRFCCRQGAL